MSDTWTVLVHEDGGTRTLGHYSDHFMARDALARLRQGKSIKAEVRWELDGAEGSFDPDAPTLRNALDLCFRPTRHLTVPNLATMLGVTVPSLQSAIVPIKEIGVVDVTEQALEGGVAETWHELVKPADAIFESAVRRGVALDAPLAVA